MKKIVFTGGGSAGHVTPNIALINRLRAQGWSMAYIGSERGIERTIIEELGDVPYHPIATGKLRRYLDINNFKDPFRVLKGVFQSYRILKELKPDVVFSKGGFVSVPVIMGSKWNGIPVIIHESDMTPGLANKIAIPMAAKVCVTFPETMEHVPKGKAEYTGAPIREELLQGNPDLGRKLCGFQSNRPVLLIMGGSLGSQLINKAVRDSLDTLLTHFQIVHICGKGNRDERYADKPGYKQFEYIGKELPDLLALSDLAVSRAGSNAIFEFLAAQIPMLLIPLSKRASRGDQLLNADSFAKRGYCHILYEENLNADTFVTEVMRLREKKSEIIDHMGKNSTNDSVAQIIGLIQSAASV